MLLGLGFVIGHPSVLFVSSLAGIWLAWSEKLSPFYS